MPLEIERKFLVVGDAWRECADAGVRYRQGYLATNERCSVRVRVGGGKAALNVKSAERGARRSEFEYVLPPDEADELLTALCARPLVEKTRYLVEHGGKRWEVDVFEGDNEGLVVAEIELTREDESFSVPPWAGRELTDDVRFYNSYLAERPFGSWSEADRAAVLAGMGAA